LLSAADELAKTSDVELFVQRGAEAADFAHLPGAALMSREDFAGRVAWADVVICHGGAGTLHETLCAGHIPLVMARLARFAEHVNDHQIELVQALEERGRLLSFSTSQELRARLPSCGQRNPANGTALASSLTQQVALALANAGNMHRSAFTCRRLVRLSCGLLSRTSLEALLVGGARRRRADPSATLDL
jgi:UDP-N-acetylglucosamine transferase subunit ALG13